MIGNLGFDGIEVINVLGTVQTILCSKAPTKSLLIMSVTFDLD